MGGEPGCSWPPTPPPLLHLQGPAGTPGPEGRQGEKAPRWGEPPGCWDAHCTALPCPAPPRPHPPAPRRLPPAPSSGGVPCPPYPGGLGSAPPLSPPTHLGSAAPTTPSSAIGHFFGVFQGDPGAVGAPGKTGLWVLQAPAGKPGPDGLRGLPGSSGKSSEARWAGRGVVRFWLLISGSPQICRVSKARPGATGQAGPPGPVVMTVDGVGWGGAPGAVGILPWRKLEWWSHLPGESDFTILPTGTPRATLASGRHWGQGREGE